MLSYQSLKKTQLTLRSRHRREYARVLDALRELDPEVRALEYAEALTSRKLVRVLWEALPEEHEALTFASPEAQTAEATGLLRAAPTTPVTLHLGWENLAFSTTLHAAWHAWPRFCHVHTDALNVCIYPNSLEWYLVRAGRNLYPMDCTRGADPELATR